jgi:DNA-binding NtrC family response regulator
VALNSSALPPTLFEALLFGHERGVFTGAEKRRRGQLELVGKGTLLLDEIADMPLDLQSKLLRVLEEKRFRPLGSEEELPFRARVVAATHVDLEGRVAKGRFRDDLFYRLHVVSIDVPSLADRRGDIPELMLHFVSQLANPIRFDDDACEWLARRDWPGNVRELRNAIERVALLADEPVVGVGTLDDLVGRIQPANIVEVDKLARAILALPERLGSKLDVIERAVLHHAIESCRGNKSAAARLVGLERKALERKWDRLSDAPGKAGADGEKDE